MRRFPQLEQWEPVEITWTDSNGGGGEWIEITASLQSIHGVVTVGQVYSQDDDRITVVLTRDWASEMVHGFITIPTVAISRLVRLIPK